MFEPLLGIALAAIACFTWVGSVPASAGKQSNTNQISNTQAQPTNRLTIRDQSISGRFSGPRVFDVDGRRFTNSLGFVLWVGTLNKGTELCWNSGCAMIKAIPLEGLTVDMDEFQGMCRDLGIRLKWVHGY